MFGFKEGLLFQVIQKATEMFPCKKSNPWIEALSGPWAKELESNLGSWDIMADRPATFGLSLGVGVPIPWEYLKGFFFSRRLVWNHGHICWLMFRHYHKFAHLKL